MGILEQVMQMKSQNVPNEEIVAILKEQGFSPKAINDALNQSQIKSAVSGNQEMNEDEYQQEARQSFYNPKTQEIPQPQQAPYQTQQQEPYQAQQQAPYQAQQQAPYPTSQETQQQAQEYYQPEAYGGYEGYPNTAYPSQTATDTDTIIEIAEQVFSEKIRKMQKQIEDISELKALTETKMDNIEERLKRIEAVIDKMQITVIEKISSYSRGLENVKKELSIIQESPRKTSSAKRKPRKSRKK